MRYKFELVDKKYQLIQLESSKSSIKDLFNDLLDGKKSFKHQITVKIFLKKYKGTDIESSPVYFKFNNKKVINHKFSFDKSFQEILYRIDNWIKESSGWIIGSIISQYINISNYRPLLGSF